MSFTADDSQVVDQFCQELLKITNCTKADINKFFDELSDLKQIMPQIQSEIPSV